MPQISENNTRKHPFNYEKSLVAISSGLRAPLGRIVRVGYSVNGMDALSVYIAIAVLMMATAATILCLSYYGVFKNRSAFWLSMCMVGLSWFALTGLMFQLSDLATANSSALGPAGLRLIWQALGAVFVVHALPRFLLSAFGVTLRPAALRLLDSATIVVILLSVVRIATGWHTTSSIAVVPNSILRIFLYVFIGTALIATLIFQSRLPDRSLYRTVVVQIGAIALLFPFVLLEDLGLFAIPGFPYLGGEILLAATSVSATAHARRSLRRPKYVVGRSPSSYFAERFGISERELEVASCVLAGLSNNEIAAKLFISPRTVETHLYNIYQKAGIRNRVQLFNLLRSDEL